MPESKRSAYVLDNVARIAEQAGLVKSQDCCGVPSKFCRSDVWKGNLGTFARLFLKEHEQNPFIGFDIESSESPPMESIDQETETTVPLADWQYPHLEPTVRNRNLASVLSALELDLFFTADRYYNSTDMRYHDIAHANSVVDAAWKICVKPTACLLLAAKWHDAIYVGGGSFNEHLSARAFKKEAQKLDIYEELAAASRMIEETVLSSHLSDDDYRGTQTAVLLDADLSEMAVGYEDFVSNQLALISEHRIASGFLPISSRPASIDVMGCAWMDKAAQFLGKFLAKQSIYRTPRGKELYEAKARENITRFREEWLLKSA